MIGLRQLSQRVEDPGWNRGVRTLWSLVSPYRETAAPISLREVLARGDGLRWIRPAPLTVLAQNTALMPPYVLGGEVLYKGSEREAALSTIIARIREERPDVVGLSECWVKFERNRIRTELADLYPHVVEGPDIGAALNLANYAALLGSAVTQIPDVPMSSGLILLSRHAISKTHLTPFPHAYGEDSLANKGAVHARISVPAAWGSQEYDVFLTHMQANPKEGSVFLVAGRGTDGVSTRRWQLQHLASFVGAHTSPERPALLMGDLNVGEAERAELKTLLPGHDDLWIVCGVPHPDALTGTGFAGVTLDDANTFEAQRMMLPHGDPSPTNGNSRLDYVLSWRGTARWPLYKQMDVVTWKTAGGRHVSDHYGTRVVQTHLRERRVDTSRAIRKVTLTLHGFHCLRVTRWTDLFARADADEVRFRMRYRTALGATGESAMSQTYTGVMTGDARELVPQMQGVFTVPGTGPLRLELGEPGAWLDILGEGEERDDDPVFATSSASLGEGTRRLTREVLLQQGVWTFDHVLPLLTGDGGEYAVKVSVAVDSTP